MFRSWRRLPPALVAELGGSTSPVEDPHGPWSYRAAIDGETLVQVETLREEGSQHVLRREAAYVVGSGSHARAFVAEENGYLTQLPLAWFAEGKRWRLSPGYELHNRRFERPIVPACIACHGGLAVHLRPTRNRYRLPIEDGIGCERCHGPGESHVALHRSRADERPASDPIVEPAHLSAERANDVCLQCHLQGDVSIYEASADAFSFRPGDRLSDHRLDFLIETDAPAAFGVASHGARMMQSRCFLESGRQLTCVHCHHAHRPVRAFEAAYYERKCLTCHAVESCTRPEEPRVSTSGPLGCVLCHMPQRKTREGQHLVFTDHCIRRPPRAPQEEPPVP
ncbi:MAG: hypothetical protein KY476_19280, partial [Planctomycetes bacterium]|nr:hypothetical protein [Planctomycetota bacterium]